MTLVLERLRVDGQVMFESLFTDAGTRMAVIVTFLAMLELVKIRAIRIFQDRLDGPIIIEAAVGVEQAAEVIANKQLRKIGMEGESLKSIVESLLFVAEGPLTLQRLAEVIEGADRSEITAALEQIRTDLESNRRGVRLVEVAGGYQLGLQRKTPIG